MKQLKTLWALVAIVTLGMSAQAQYYYLPSTTNGNPGGLNADSEYPVGGGLSTTWTSISSPGASTPQWSSINAVPFAFNFNGSAVTHYKVSTSGVLTFDTAATTPPPYTKAALPNANIPDKSVCIWGLAGPGANDIIVKKTFGTAPNRQHWVFFASYDAYGSSCWTYWSIVMEETSNKIYVVDQRNSCTSASFSIGIQVNSTTAYSVAGSPNVSPLATTDATPADNHYYEFIPGSQPANNLVGNAVTTADFLILGNAPFTVSADYLNGGANAITSTNVNYSINGGAPVTGSLTGLNIASGTSSSLSHPTAWTPSSVGTYDITFWTSNPNGSADDVPNNDTVTKQVVVVSQIAVRAPLIEVFTSSTCGPCAPANTTFTALMGQQTAGDYNFIKYQMSWPGSGDPYYTQEAGTKRTFYGVNSVPNAQIDGGWNGHAGQITQSILNDFKSEPSFVDISGFYYVDSQTVHMEFDIDPMVSTNKNLTLNVAIFERSTDNNVKSNGETIFHHVFKKFVPDQTGTMINGMTEGQTIHKTMNYTFNGSYTLPANATAPVNHAIAHTVEEFSDLSVMVWIQDNSTKEIYQSFELTQSAVGLDEGFMPKVGLYPNPANSWITMDFRGVKEPQADYRIINALGQTVTTGSFDLSNSRTPGVDVATFAPGLYFVVWNTESYHGSESFQVAH